jgi:hypothetical protein
MYSYNSNSLRWNIHRQNQTFPQGNTEQKVIKGSKAHEGTAQNNSFPGYPYHNGAQHYSAFRYTHQIITKAEMRIYGI